MRIRGKRLLAPCAKLPREMTAYVALAEVLDVPLLTRARIEVV